MKVSVRLFAVAKQLAGTDVVTLELPEGSSLAKLRSAMANDWPALAAVLPQVVFAIDSQYMDDETAIPASAEVACIPPVSGG